MTAFAKVMRAAVICAALVAMFASLPVNAEIIIDNRLDHMWDAGEGVVGQIDIYVTVEKLVLGPSQNLYTYTYLLDYVDGTADVHIWGLENPNDIPFFSATNNIGFDSPAYVSRSWAPHALEWQGLNGAALRPHTQATFSYQSYRAPMDIGVYTYAINGGLGAEGFTVGMSDMIPEPSSILALAVGILGVAPRMIRRRK